MKKNHPILIIIVAIVLGSASTAGTYFVLRMSTSGTDNGIKQDSKSNTQVDNGSIVNIPPRKNTNTIAYSPDTFNGSTNSSTITTPVLTNTQPTEETPETPTWQTYSNPTYGFSLQYPPSWQLTFEETDTELHYFLLSIQPPDTEDFFIFGRQAMGFEDTETLEEVDTTLGGQPARNITLQDPETDKTFALLLMAKKVPKKYQTYFGSYALGIPELIPDYEKIAASITLSE